MESLIMPRFCRYLPILALLGLVAGHQTLGNNLRGEEPGGPDKAALERTRHTAKMLDDLYKTAVVGITATYVTAQEKTPAAKVAMKIFKVMADKGYHKARLIDATGDPINRANLPKSDFEKKVVAELKAGKTYVEEVSKVKDQPVLRVGTIVPVVMKQCIACHPGLKEGDLIGALVYEIPIK
jgi:hypothetical protein